VLQHRVHVETTTCFKHVLVIAQPASLMAEDLLVLVWQAALAPTPLGYLRDGEVTPPVRRGARRHMYAPPAASKRTSVVTGQAGDSAIRFAAVSAASGAYAGLSPRSPSVCSPSELDGSTSDIELHFRGILTLFTA